MERVVADPAIPIGGENGEVSTTAPIGKKLTDRFERWVFDGCLILILQYMSCSFSHDRLCTCFP